MSPTRCTTCSKTAAGLPAGQKMANCGKCIKAGVAVAYCSRACQIADFKRHKLTCGKPRPASASTAPPPPTPATATRPFLPPPALQIHSSLLASLPTPSPPTLPPSFIYFPSSPLQPSSSTSPVPTTLTLPSHAHPLFVRLRQTANASGSALAVNLMYSLLLEMVEQAGGSERRLIAQLSEEYGLDLAAALTDEEEPDEGELEVAVGGDEGMEDLVLWQQAEAERLRRAGLATA